MNNVTSLAIDLAKNTFQVHGTDKNGKAIYEKAISRAKLLNFVANLPICNIYMEACGSANYWGREFEKLGHKVKLINPKYVKPYVKRNKNDRNDAEAIAVAARDPDMRFCHIKTIEQQDVQSIHRIRQLLVAQRTGLANQARGLIAEYGIAVPKGVTKIRQKIAEILGENPYDMSALLLQGLAMLYEEFENIDNQITACEKQISELFKKSETCQRLETIPGIGELTATILATVLGNGSNFKNGRHFAAFLGLVPKQHSSGGKERLLGISKGGDTYIRTLLIHGARTVLLWVKNKTDKRSMRLKDLLARKHKNIVAVALANKMARMAWALARYNVEYDPNHKHAISPATALD
jgi:transposase